MAGYLIAAVAFALPLAFAVTGLGRPRIVLAVGAVLALGWLVSLAAVQAEDSRGEAVIPLWLLGGLVALLYAIWCGGFWLGLRLRRMRAREPLG
jgi:hypothetical protein